MNQGIEPKSRIEWVDVARFLCAFIILSQHMSLVAPYFMPRGIGCNILWDHAVVPLFFLLSGYFVKPTPHLINWQRLYKLIIPTLFWCFFGAIILQGIQDISTLNWWEKMLGISSTLEGERLSFLGDPTNGPLWFMIFLIFFSLMAPLVKKLSCQWQAGIASACIVLGKHYICAELLSYFVVGIALSNIPIQQIGNFLNKICVPVVIVAIAIPVALILRKGGNNCTLASDRLTIWYGITVFFSIAVLICRISPHAGSKMASWGKFAFFIYVAHWPLEVLFRRTWSDCPMWVYSLFPLVLTVALLQAAKLTVRLAPRLACLLLMVNHPRSKTL